MKALPAATLLLVLTLVILLLAIPVMAETGDLNITDLTEEPTTGDELTIHVSVNTTEEIESVHVEHRQDDGEFTNTSMGGLADEFVASITIDRLSKFLEYWYSVQTKSGKWSTTELFNRSVLDDDPPTVNAMIPFDTLSTGKRSGFMASVWDNIGVDHVWAIFWFGEGVDDARNVTLYELFIVSGFETHGSTEGFNVSMDSLDPLHYQLFAMDKAGNQNSTGIIDVTVYDSIDPSMVEDLSDINATTGEDFWFRVNVTDNIGVEGVVLAVNNELINMSAQDIEGWGVGIYRHMITIDSGRSWPIKYSFIITDQYGNERTTWEILIDVVDNDAPSFEGHFHTYTYKGLHTTFGVDAVDNIGVNITTVEYWFNEGAHEVREMNRTQAPFNPNSVPFADFVLSIKIPRDAEGTISYFFTIEDAASNNASTAVTVVPFVNGVPHIEDTEVWNVTEGIEASLDLEPYLFDYNDGVEGLSVEVVSEEAWMDGFVLHVLYDVWRPNDTLVIHVSDGEDTAVGNVRVLITNVNDAPVIVSIEPENDAVFIEGTPITFSVNVEDEDGDPLTISWERGIGVLHRGESFNTTDLGPGRHIITLYIHDREVELRQDITVEVFAMAEGDEEPSSDPFGVWMWSVSVVLVAIVVVVTALVWAAKRK